MQSRRDSLIETVTSTCVGLVGSWLITILTMTYSPWPPLITGSVIVALCTVWSLVRGYSIRRLFARRRNQ